MNVSVPTTPLGEFATRLAADESGDVKRECCGIFDAAHSDARRRLYEPLTTEEHEATVALVEGTRQCSEVISTVWNALHP